MNIRHSKWVLCFLSVLGIFTFVQGHADGLLIKRHDLKEEQVRHAQAKIAQIKIPKTPKTPS